MLRKTLIALGILVAITATAIITNVGQRFGAQVVGGSVSSSAPSGITLPVEPSRGNTSVTDECTLMGTACFMTDTCRAKGPAWECAINKDTNTCECMTKKIQCQRTGGTRDIPQCGGRCYKNGKSGAEDPNVECGMEDIDSGDCGCWEKNKVYCCVPTLSLLGGRTACKQRRGNYCQPHEPGPFQSEADCKAVCF